mmetsp:Transcript_28069/g.60411  ORF Transcript_28069/g.60411 Transcript_28069/m.60411 type:complete len:228 (+) Transcript_28069:778-1461(+)
MLQGALAPEECLRKEEAERAHAEPHEALDQHVPSLGRAPARTALQTGCAESCRSGGHWLDGPHQLLEHADKRGEGVAYERADDACTQRDCHCGSVSQRMADCTIHKVSTNGRFGCEHCLGDDGSNRRTHCRRQCIVRARVQPRGGTGDLQHEKSSNDGHVDECGECSCRAGEAHHSRARVVSSTIETFGKSRADEATGDDHRRLGPDAEAEGGREQGEQQQRREIWP